ncbi:transposase [Nonomuraea turkmeniaca]|uniref:Transposase n=1 Tax=Nonomuraea turkmeniaca TaxID=103838 RepID=A0A5S4FYB2_9ACTN|nr:transposase [Nonomuraea turkmeniaca]
MPAAAARQAHGHARSPGTAPCRSRSASSQLPASAGLRQTVRPIYRLDTSARYAVTHHAASPAWRAAAPAPRRPARSRARYGNGKTVYNRHRRWSMEGVWAKILYALLVGCDQAEGADWTVSMDSIEVRAHQHALPVAASRPR